MYLLLYLLLYLLFILENYKIRLHSVSLHTKNFRLLYKVLKYEASSFLETTTLPSTTSVAATVSEKDSSKGTLPDRTSTTPSSPSNVEDSEAKNLGKTTNKSGMFASTINILDCDLKSVASNNF